MKNISRKLLVLTAPILLVGCGGNKADPYASLNNALKETYQGFHLQVVTEADGITLTSTYNFSLSDGTYVVDYEEQKMGTIDPSSPANNMVVTDYGTRQISATEIGFTKFTVDSKYNDIKYHKEEGTFSAHVKDGQAFLGVSYSVDTLDVNITFTENKLTEVDYTYVDASTFTHTVSYSNFR